MTLKKRGVYSCLLLWLLAFGVANNAAALLISMTSDSNFNVDFPNSGPVFQCNHESFIITNNDGATYSNLWVTLGSFTNTTTMQLGNGDPGQYPLSTLTNNGTIAAFFFVQANNNPGTGNSTYNNRFTVSVYKGYPATGTLLASSNFVMTVRNTIAASANKINSVTFTPTNNPVVGGIVKISVYGDTGGVGSGNLMDFTGASWTNWNGAAFQLIACNISVTNGTAPAFNQYLTNGLSATANSHFTGNGNLYQADYYFRAIATTPTTTPISPISYIGSGANNMKHTSLNAGVLPDVLAATNKTTLGFAVTSTQAYTNTIVTFTLHVTNASTAYDVTLDRFVNTLPTNFTYVANSSTFNGLPVLDPTNINQVLTWSQPYTYTVPAGTVRDFSFQAVVASVNVPVFFTNSCAGYVENTLIDTTLNTSDNVPATEVVRALIAPTAANISTNTLENQTLNAVAPGVLANTAEPNGFSATVVSYTQPAHGGVTVNGDGSYIYVPTAYYWGADAFTFTITNQNGRISTATNNITVIWVNQPPYFTKGADQSALENSGAQTVANWANGISVGTNDPVQTLTFQISNNNSNLFSAQPQISSSGTLTYTPAAFAHGTATVTVYLKDDGGTANGGSDTSGSQTFTVTVNAVNQPPYFTIGADQTVLEDAGAQTIANWATGISSGTNDPAQVLTFHVSDNNSNLFSVQPAISSSGILTFTPAADANGSATVTVYLTDDGGTANGGNDISASQTFSINVTAVNDPPTINPISDVTVVEDWTRQTVNFNGITIGPTNENGQSILSITATSSNPSLIPNPTVNYTSANTNGSLTFTPATNSFGVATITVVVKDDGGTANGGVDSVTNIFTVSLLGLTNDWFGGSNLVVDIFDAAGGSASQTNYRGVLDVPATSGNPFVIKPTGLAADFNSQSNYTWTIATTTRGIENFATNKIIFDASAFTNDMAGGYFTVTLSPDGGSVELNFVGNRGPAADAALYSRAFNTAIRIPIANLLTNYTTDPDGDARILVSAGGSTNGSIITTNSLFINFGPTNNFTESFPYVIRDNRAYRSGDTVLYATNWITILAIPTVGYANTITPHGDGSLSIKFAGIPRYAYDIQRATNPSGPWNTIFTTNAPPNGIWIYVDSSPPQPVAFYRTQQH